jgi:multicomponent K+:H+ antiporter subunit D
MTKVGIYAIVRLSLTVFAADAGPLAGVGQPILFALGLVTMAFAALGALAARRLTALIAYLVLMSSGTLIAASTLGPAALGGALYYLVHTTLTVAVLFLLAHAIGDQRGPLKDRFGSGPPVAQPALLGLLFLVSAIGAAGLPPLSGFIGKVLMLQGSGQAPHVAWFWASVLGSGLFATFALARAGGVMFWKTHGAAVGMPIPAGDRMALAILSATVLFWVVCAGPAAQYTAATALQLTQPHEYIGAVHWHLNVSPPPGIVR